MSEVLTVSVVASVLVMVGYGFWPVIKEGIARWKTARRAAQIKRNRSDGAKRGAATRRANREKALLAVRPETTDGQPAITS